MKKSLLVTTVIAAGIATIGAMLAQEPARTSDLVWDFDLPTYKMVVKPQKFDTFLECTAYWYLDPVDASGTGITATGNKCIPGKTLAVDPKVIPFSSKVYFHRTKETFVADDTGGDIEGFKGDRATASEEEAIQYGRRIEYVTVFLPYQPEIHFEKIEKVKTQDFIDYQLRSGLKFSNRWKIFKEQFENAKNKDRLIRGKEKCKNT